MSTAGVTRTTLSRNSTFIGTTIRGTITGDTRAGALRSISVSCCHTSRFTSTSRIGGIEDTTTVTTCANAVIGATIGTHGAIAAAEPN